MTDHVRKIEPAEISTRLVCLRESIGLSQQQMAAACAVTPRAYRAWERGDRKWHRSRFLDKVCTASGVSGSWLLTGSYHFEPPSVMPLARDGLPLPKGRRMHVSDPGE